MKKLRTILAVVFLGAITACTDSTFDEIQETILEQETVFSTDDDEYSKPKRPGD